MAIKFRKRAIKFLEKANPEDVERIQEQLNQIFLSIEEQGIIPFTELDLKKMKGDWEGFYRLRIDKVRILFTVDIDSNDIEIYADVSRKGLFLNVEQVQPRRSDQNASANNDALAPIPDFTDIQLDRLALVYVAASVRCGKWLIPVFHASVDAGYSKCSRRSTEL